MKEPRICRGSWCFTFGMEPMATLDQVIDVLAAFGYDGIELAGFHDHATLQRFPDRASRRQLADRIKAKGLEVAGYAPGPYGDFGRLPWATGDDAVVKEYWRFFEDSLRLCVDVGSPAIRVDPGNFGPLPRDVDYRRTWDRVVETFRKMAATAADAGVLALWEFETGQIFTRPSEIPELLDAVGHPNLKLLYDVALVQAAVALGHNQVQPVETLPGGQVELVRRLKGKIGHMHVTDCDNNTYANAFGRHLGLGKGVVDFDELIPAVIAAGYEGPWWSVDAIPMGPETWADTWTDVRALRELIARHSR